MACRITKKSVDDSDNDDDDNDDRGGVGGRWERRNHFSLVQLLSRVQLFATSWTAARQASLSITNSWSLLKLMSIESVMPSNHLSQFFASGGQSTGVSVSASVLPVNIQGILISWTQRKYSKEILISFRIDWLALLAVQGTLKSLFQNYSSKTSILLCSAFFIVQFSHPYMTTRKP